MLQDLFGNISVVRTLFYLFVNRSGYPTELAISLQCALTPLQKAFSRLERAGVLKSEYIGRTRLYSFNPNFPLLEELELFLKKAYTLLPAEEKKGYAKRNTPSFSTKKERFIPAKALFEAWQRLKKITTLSFHTHYLTQTTPHFSANGQGLICVIEENAHTLIFQEKGTWLDKQGSETTFSNCYRWTQDKGRHLLSLEHLRYGKEHPVFLFHLAPTSSTLFSSLDAHFCEQDCYFGKLTLRPQELELRWRVIGNKKNEEITYIYK